MSSQQIIRALLCDDHEVMRGLIRAMLDAETDISVVSETADVEALVRESSREQPDVVVLDGRLEVQDGFDSIAAILSASPKSRILMFSSEADPAYQRRAVALGAHGYLLKDSAEHLATAVRVVKGGGTYVDARFALRTAPDDKDGPGGLRARAVGNAVGPPVF